MSGLPGSRSGAPLVLAVVLAILSVAIPVASPPSGAVARSAWTGSVDLYRAGTFSTQRSWLWCTAADVQIIRNIARRESDQSKANQRRYFAYMRARNRYDIPVADGVDPAGWAAGLRHYVDRRYRLTIDTSFDAALRSAVTNLRTTNLPVGITVARGGHAWVLTGFSATADPAATRDFTVTSVRVVGPLWGLQSRRYGYDMRPDTKLTTKQLRGFFTKWHYAGVRMAWEGRWVSVQPVPAPAPTPSSTPTSTPTPDPSSSLSAAPIQTAASSPTRSPRPSPDTSPASRALARAEPPMSATPGMPASTPAGPARADPAIVRWIGLSVVAPVGLVVLGGTWWRRRRT